MMTTSLAQIAGEPARQAKPDGDETDPEVLAARAAAELPAGFVWGAATSAYQIEGAIAADGRRPSIWDTFAATPGKTWGGESGDPACDHYHRYVDDVALMAELGLRAYRFSVAWPRVVPTGRGAANAAGIDFYDRLVDELLAAGVDPWATLYHWDLPQDLQDQGGWSERDTAYRFADYADRVAGALADRVRHWSTLNEPFCSAFEGHMSGRHAPGIQSPVIAVRTVHHLLLGHGLATAALRSRGVMDVGISLNLIPAEPADDSPGALDAARLVDGQQIRVFLDPLLRGRYPDDVVGDFARAGARLPITGNDAQLIAAPIDWIGVNYYAPHIVAPGPDPGPRSPFIPGDAVALVGASDNVTALGWPVRPHSFAALLRRLHRDYPEVPLYVHENGAAFHDAVSADGTIDDPARRGYIARHIDAVRAAVRDGVNVRGYFAWSLLDNYEWAEGYRMRFGIVHVDFATQRRTLKSSARWYAHLMRAHRQAGGPP
ncbi:MAG TPA: GH1 family beta-glucosidase [Kofleriaceae bacterium]|jgi:beta-glucosidase|nr:GH1 family beta-glucosidase [Kofleriaceae bacterium]